MKGLLSEIMGLPSGVCGGIGGSQHLHTRNFYSNGILGGMTPVTTGIALAQKMDGRQGISVVFSGDGAMAEGVIYEALNIAALWQLPLLLVVEHNKIAQSTPWMLEHSTPIEGRPIAFGVDTVSVDGNDALLVHKTTQQLVDEMRETPSPRCLVLHTNRLGPHSKGDDTRDLHEIEGLRAFDPIRQLSAKIPKSRISAIHQECEAELNDLLAEFSIF
jgi:TPP-dependent pyruvate/acetoin dehydrogenase alpha subunit